MKKLCALTLLLVACSGGYTADNIEVKCFGTKPVTQLVSPQEYYYHGSTKVSLYRCPDDENVFSESPIYSNKAQLLAWDGESVQVTFTRDLTEEESKLMRKLGLRLQGKPIPGIYTYSGTVKNLGIANTIFETQRELVKTISPVFIRFGRV